MRVSTEVPVVTHLFADNVCSQDKKNVDEYKARIKAQLSRAGLIRGQPRHAVQAHSQRGPPRQARSTLSRNGSTRSDFDSFHNVVEPPFAQNHGGHLVAGMPS
jgi:C6 transcription factor Pro1